MTEQFLRIPSARIMLVERGRYSLSDVYVDTDDGKTLFARLDGDTYAKLGTALGEEAGTRSTSVPTISWDRIAGIAYQETAYTIELVGKMVETTTEADMHRTYRVQSTFPEEKR